MRITKNVDKGIISWSDTKFSKLTSQDVWQTVRELLMRSWELKGHYASRQKLHNKEGSRF